MAIDTEDFFTSRELVDDPYPYYEALRARCPIARERHHDVMRKDLIERARGRRIKKAGGWDSRPWPCTAMPNGSPPAPR